MSSPTSSSVLPKGEGPSVEEKKADEETNASCSQDGYDEEAAQTVGAFIAPSASPKVVAPIKGTSISSPIIKGSAAEHKEADIHAPISQARRRAMRAKRAKAARRRAKQTARSVWDGNIHPKIRKTVKTPKERSRVQIIAYLLIVAFFLVAMVYVYMTERCKTVNALLATFSAMELDNYNCDDILVPQEFSGQTYYEAAYYYGFAVHAAWGTFRGANWTSYCVGLLDLATDAVINREEDPLVNGVLERYTYEGIDGNLISCNRTVFWKTGLQSLPNAPGGVFGCSYRSPEVEGGNSISCALGNVLLDPEEYSQIGAWIFEGGDVGNISGDFCPDIMLWDNDVVRGSPLDKLEYENDARDATEKICSMWGQDVGIVSKAVQNCTGEICTDWWQIAADAIAIALGVEVVWIFVALIMYKLLGQENPKKHPNQHSKQPNVNNHENASADGGVDNAERVQDVKEACCPLILRVTCNLWCKKER
eukprot:g5647.t1